ncbi:amino acid deaminase [Kribbella sancticallisti]|uniref:Amino acid deaminase n=1 Tax=Kribbella sancticallisti TaxID=460087 RepID=A0ABN2DUJ4_9ACTN
MIDSAALAALDGRVLGPEHKSFPPAAWGKTVREYLSAGPTLDWLSTPLLTVDRAALQSNVALMASWARSAGIQLAPHGKTTMAPQLWALQFDAGAWGITLATPWQVQLARSFGVGRILLANPMVDPVALAWLAGELRADPSFDFFSWADSVRTAELMDRALGSSQLERPVNVIVEIGGPGGRSGARSSETALAVAMAIHRSPRLALAGIGGYEGALSHDRESAGLSAVRRFVDRIGRLHQRIAADGLYGTDAIVTAGGSAFHDIVVDQLAGLAGERNGLRTTVLVRPGAYAIHDDGLYAGISPLAPARAEHPLRSAMHGWARTLSRPEPELALLDAGKRDLPFDVGLPVPQRIMGANPGAFGADLARASVTALNTQHAFLRLPGSTADAVPVGTVVRLGLSDPCTAFDKWRLIPVVDDANAANPRIVELLHTFF